MPRVTAAVEVQASVRKLWGLLIDEIEHPDNYAPGVSRVTIIEKTPSSVLREINVRGTVVRERVTWDDAARQVTFTLVDHKAYTGQVFNRIRAEDGYWPILEFEMDWLPLTGTEPPEGAQLGDVLRSTLRHTKMLAERT